MASREEVSLFRAARRGHMGAQVALGRCYLFGGSGLPRNAQTALYWLTCAARQGAAEAWMLIGTHIPYETALRVTDRSELYVWYERAADEGVLQAGLVLARMVLVADKGQHEASIRRKAWQALERAAESGMAEAQWLLAQQVNNCEAMAEHACGNQLSRHSRAERGIEWVRRAADNGVVAAQHWLADYAWEKSDDAQFLHWALPLASALAKEYWRADAHGCHLTDDDKLMLSRCAQVLFRTRHFDAIAIDKVAEPAARAGDKHAQFSLGMWCAKMDETGRRVDGIARQINYRMALHWLDMAGQKGVPDAWFVISRIYLKAAFAQRSVADAERYLSYAAQAGHLAAQLELGKRLWRKRRCDASNDIEAVYWLQRASAQGCAEADQLLRKATACAVTAPWAQAMQCKLSSKEDPLLVARISLAARFGLSIHEALLLDVDAADCGHCLVVDIRDRFARSRRRLIRIQAGEERLVLDHIKGVFERILGGARDQEGNYRQRLYRLKAALVSQHSMNPWQHNPRKEGNCHYVTQTSRKTPDIF